MAAVEEIPMMTMIMLMVLTAITIKYYHWHNRHSPWCKVNSDKKPNCLDFLKVLYFFFLAGYAILKFFAYLFGAKFTGQNFHRDIMTINQ